MQKRRVLNSARLAEFRRQKRRVLRNKIILVVVLILVIFVSLGFAARAPGVNINTVNITGNKLIETESIDLATSEVLSGKYFWLYPKSNSFIYPKQQLKDVLTRKFKRIETIDIAVDGYQRLSISIVERGAKYTWCGHDMPRAAETPDEFLNLIDSGKCYFLDEYGYIFDEAPYFSGSVYFKFYGGVEDLEVPLGSRVEPIYFEDLAYFKELVTQIGLKPVAMVLKPDDEVDMYLSAKTEPPHAPKVTFKLNSDYKKLAENLQAAVSTEPLRSDLESKYAGLSYIDLRFDNKVYYKFK